MPFGIDTSGIPSIPGLSTVSANPVSGITGKTKELITAMTEDRSALFANPMVNVVTSTNNTLDQLKGQLESIADGSIINEKISAGDASTFLSGPTILDAQTALGDFLSHTDRLSGVLKGAGVSSPGLEEILSIGKQMNDYVNILNAGSGCLSMVGGATGLFSGPDIDSKASAIVNVMENINRGVATIANISEAVSGLKDLVLGIISKDSQFLQNCLSQLQSAALATALEYVFQDPCAKFVLETITNKNPGGLVSRLVR